MSHFSHDRTKVWECYSQRTSIRGKYTATINVYLCVRAVCNDPQSKHLQEQIDMLHVSEWKLMILLTSMFPFLLEMSNTGQSVLRF